jgi:hypothetical protein
MDVLQTLKAERSRAAKELQKLDTAIKALGGWSSSGKQSTGTRRTTMSAAGRARIAAAQRARLAKVKANAGQKQGVVGKAKPTAARKRPKLSAAAKARIAAAQRARWAKIRAAKKGR